MTTKTANAEFLNHLNFGKNEAETLQGAEKVELLTDIAEQGIGALLRRGAKVDHLEFGLTEAGELEGDEAIEALEILVDEVISAFGR